MSRNIIRIGDSHSCGSTDIQGSSDVFANMKNVHRKGDADSHGGTQIEASPDVFCNGINVARVGDDNSGCISPPHPPNPEIGGSPNVFVN